MRSDHCRDHQDYLVIQVRRDVEGRKAHLECKAHLEHWANQVNLVKMDIKDHQENPAHKVNAVFAQSTVLWMVVYSSKMVQDAEETTEKKVRQDCSSLSIFFNLTFPRLLFDENTISPSLALLITSYFPHPKNIQFQ